MAQYDDWSTEFVLCNYLKRSLDRIFHISYPNRNKYMHILFDTVSVIKDMQDFVIVKFDFKNYFNSLASEYIFNKYIANSNMVRADKDLFQQFTTDCPKCFAGLSTSNVMAEMIAQEFDEILVQKLVDRGLIFFRRYVDDGIIIFNQFITQDECIKILNDIIHYVFKNPSIEGNTRCKVKLNPTKFQYIARRHFNVGTPQSFDFLGYQFELTLVGKKCEVKYGLTQKKMQKYTRQIEQLLADFTLEPNTELLRQRILAFASRTVYQINRYNTRIWKVKGFISNYCELRFHNEQLIPDTEHFLRHVITDTCTRVCPSLPYFLKNVNAAETPYQLYNNLVNNRTLLLHETIGIDINTLISKCQQVGINASPTKSYDYYTREYLIKLKVGH